MDTVNDANLLLLCIGGAGALWCVGLALCLVYLDEAHRAKVVRVVGQALFTVLVQIGGPHRQNEDATSPR